MTLLRSVQQFACSCTTSVQVLPGVLVDCCTAAANVADFKSMLVELSGPQTAAEPSHDEQLPQPPQAGETGPQTASVAAAGVTWLLLLLPLQSAAADMLASCICRTSSTSCRVSAGTGTRGARLFMPVLQLMPAAGLGPNLAVPVCTPSTVSSQLAAAGDTTWRRPKQAAVTVTAVLGFGRLSQ
jgi:hypothetical protein